MRAIALTITGAALLISSLLAVAVAMTPRECDALSGWVYTQAQLRDTGITKAEHEAIILSANEGKHGPDVISLLVRELEKVYAEGKPPIEAAMNARYECYRRKGEIGTEVKQET